MVIEGGLALVYAQAKTDSMTAAFSSSELLNALGGLANPLVKTAAPPPFVILPLANLLVQIV